MEAPSTTLFLDEFIIKSNGNTLVQATKTSAFMGDGTKIIGDDNYFDFSHFQKVSLKFLTTMSLAPRTMM